MTARKKRAAPVRRPRTTLTASDLVGRVALTDAELGLLVGVSYATVNRLRKEDAAFPKAVSLLHPGGLARTDKAAFVRYWKALHRAAQGTPTTRESRALEA